MRDLIKERITVNAEIGHGKPTIRNTRYLVESILDYLAAGDSTEDVLTEFPDLERDDVLACLTFANRILRFKGVSIKAA